MRDFKKALHKIFYLYFSTITVVILAISNFGNHGALAQVTTNITPDTSLPTNSVILPNGNVFEITAGTAVGNSLFHSFQEFTVGTGDIASFSGPSGIENILSRVTGGTVSNIDGTLRSTIEGANLFFLNPAGIVFGPNASLDLSGSFHVSTADYLRLGEGAGAGFFSAVEPANDVLTTAPPAAFGFLGTSAGSLMVQDASPNQNNILSVGLGERLSFVGGEISIGDRVLEATDGTLNIVGVKSPGDVFISSAADADLGTESFTQLGDITFSDSFLTVTTTSASDAAKIVIRGGRITLQNTDVTANADFIVSDQGGIDIAASESITMTGGSLVSQPRLDGPGGVIMVSAPSLDINGGVIRTSTGFPGRAGDIELVVGTLNILNGARISSRSVDDGMAGKIEISATGAITLNQSIVTSETSGAGTAGEVSITADMFEAVNGSQIIARTSGEGRGGSVTVNATKDVIFTGTRNSASPGSETSSGILARTTGEGLGGSVNIDAQNVRILDGAILSVTTEGTGDGGTVSVTAVDTIELTSRSLDGASTFSGGIAARTTEQVDGGAGGPVTLAADTVSLTKGVTINTNTEGSGQAGNITIDANVVTVSGGSFLSAETSGSGGGGNINIFDAGSVIIEGTLLPQGSAAPLPPDFSTSSGIFARTRGSGRGGAVTIESQTVRIDDGASVSVTTSGSGSGGTVNITATEALSLEGRNLPSDVFRGGIAARTEGVENAGDIILNVGRLDVKDGIAITATSSNAGGQGNAGTITVQGTDSTSQPRMADAVTISNSEVQTVALGTGEGGAIQINANKINLEHAEISTTVTNGVDVDPSEQGSGSIALTTPDLTITGGSLTAETMGTRNAGNIALNVEKLTTQEGVIALPQGAVDATTRVRISSSSTASGNAGSVIIEGLQGNGTSAESLILADSNLRTEAEISAGGAISLNSRGLINLTDSTVSARVTGGEQSGGDVKLTATDIQLTRSTVQAQTQGAGDGGAVTLTGNTLNLLDTSLVDTSTEFGGGSAGTILMDGMDTVTVTGNSELRSQSTVSDGNAGQITVRAPNIVLADQSSISTSNTFFSGQAGNVLLDGNAVSVSGGARVTSSTSSDQLGGTVTIRSTESVTIEGSDDQGNVSRVATASFPSLIGPGGGAAGEVSISTNRFRMNSGEITAATASEGNAGKITVTAQSVELEQGAFIASDTLGQGNAGTVTFTATDSFAATGVDLVTNTPTRISSSSLGTGDAGQVFISAPVLTVTDSAEVTTRTFGIGVGGAIELSGTQVRLVNGAGVDSSTFAQGNAGNIRAIGTESITLSGQNAEGVSSRITTVSLAEQGGNSGSITLEAPQVTLLDQSVVSTLSQGSLGNAGDITVIGENSISLQNSSIDTSATQSSGGNIKLDANEFILLFASTIQANVLGDVDTIGGNISLDPEAIVLQNSQLITTATFGVGGNIELVGNTVLVDPNSIINASSDFGVSGSVNIQSPIQNLSGAIAPLPETIIQTATVYAAQCAAQKDGAFSSLNVRGRDRIPFEPGDYLQTPVSASQLPGAFSRSFSELRMPMVQRLGLYSESYQGTLVGSAASLEPFSNVSVLFSRRCPS